MGPAGGGRSRLRAATVATITAVALLAVGCTAAVPPPIEAGRAGADGPCTVRPIREAANPAQWQLPVFVLEPSGAASPGITGGRCDDDRRPVLLFAHGYSASFTEGYTSFLRHLVGQGFVVVYPGYQLDFDPPVQYAAMRAGLRAGLAATDRADTSRMGMVGHSWGAGMGARTLQWMDAQGWGNEALWAVLFAPAFPLEVGTGPVDLPEHLRLLAVNFDRDVFVDTRIAADLVRSVRGPRVAPRHLAVRSDDAASPPLSSDHTTPVTLGTDSDTGLDVDHYDRWGVWRPVDATAGCALRGIWCDEDLTDMGTLPDGHVVRRAEWLGPNDDVGPPAILDCDGILGLVVATRPC